VGNEGAGVVSAVGIDSCEEAMDLLGKTVAILGGSMYSQYRVVNWKQAVPMESGTTSMEAASAFVNPLTVLGMVETMKDEGHTAIVHTAAASQLGQMLVRTCADEGIPLVNVVRRPEQISLLASLGAEHIVDSSSDEFHDDLVNAISASVS
jgi:NADPH2:quinone reductase